MNILIVSRTPWDISNSFGNTFSNLFGGMKDVRIFNICCQSGMNSNDVVEQAYQMTDANVLRSIVNGFPGSVMSKSDPGKDPDVPDALENRLPHRRITLFYLCREAIWKFGRWKSPALKNFIIETKPDILYFPIYPSAYMIDVQRYVMKIARVKAVGHITDDVFVYPSNPIAAPLKALYRGWTRTKLCRHIKKMEYIEVFAQAMADEYSRKFHIPAYLIGKGIDISSITDNTDWKDDDIVTFVYTGNYGGDRGEQLINLAEAISRHFIQNGQKAVLKIYNNRHAEKKIDSRLLQTGAVQLCGGVSGDKIGEIQRCADFLVHVEGFSPTSIQETRYSFSTKIIDYLVAQRPVVAIGPKEVNSMAVLHKYDLALIATDIDGIDSLLARIAKNDFDAEILRDNALNYLRTYRDIKKIQAGMIERMKQITPPHCYNDLKISVIVPVYKVEKYLGECIDSILAQSYRNIEVILVDDGSPDNCPELCDRYAYADTRVKALHKPNGGLSDARNYGIEHATGDYLMFIDSDDYWIGKTSLERLVNELSKHTDCDIAFFGRTTFMNSCAFESSPICPELFTGNIVDDLRILLNRHEFIPSACQKLIKRTLVTDNNIYFEKGLLSEDWEWCIRLYSHTGKICGIPDNFYGYRKREGSITQSFSEKHARDILYIIDKSVTMLDNVGLSSDLKEVFLGFLAYIYSCSLGKLGVLPKNIRKQLYSEYKKHATLLRHDLNPKVKKVAGLYRLMGYDVTAGILAFFLKHRTKRLK